MIFGIISLILDYYCLNILKFSFGNLSFFFSCLTFVYIITYFYFFKKLDLSLLFIVILYSIVNFSMFFSLFLILIFYYLVKYFNIYFRKNIFLFLFFIICCIFLNDLLFCFMLFVFDYMEFKFWFVVYKFVNSLILNILYAIILYYFVPVLND